MLVSPNLHQTRHDHSTTAGDFYSFNRLAHSLPIRDSSSFSFDFTDPRIASALAVDSSDPYPTNSTDSYMQKHQPSNPPIHIQQATPRPTSVPSQSYETEVDGGVAHPSWFQSGSAAHLVPHAAQQRLNRFPSHKRHSSGSTVTSAGPASPYTPVSTAFPRIIDSESHPQFPSPNLEAYDHPSITSYPKSLPTSSATFTESFLSPAFQNYSPAHHNNENSYVYQMLSQAVMAQQESGNSSDGLPRNSSGEFEDAYKATIPKLDRTMSDIYQDELYNPSMTASASVHATVPSSQKKDQTMLSPRNDVFSERLQAANNGHMSARSLSPATTISRERSPFQLTSRYADEGFQSSRSPGSRLNAGAQMRERQKAEADANVIAYASHQPSHETQPRTISPKEALLDYNEAEDESRLPLFPQESVKHSNSNQFQDIKQESSHTPEPPSLSQRSFNSMATTRRESSSNYSTSSAQSRGNNAPRPGHNVPQQYPFIAHPRRQNSSLQSHDSVPEFPAQLTSMESTKSDTTRSSQAEPESEAEVSSSSEVQRPANTAADSGTYTCTYHGCTMRFETPSKLQKHKRDGHRQTTPSSGDNRNSQAGPHKCERINPSTGKPCNSIFSRPYDLTRHEDTIHNSKKQKVKCHLCTEEKTFSRNDALTRHMRVVHPEVDFPGKNKRK